MTAQHSIEVEHVTKRYRRLDDAPTLIGNLVQWRERRRASDFVALDDVDLAVGPGECVGVLGRNGAGKSTLLRLLAGVSSPTTGRVRVRGTVAPLLSVGVGFHPELTGRENVSVNAAVLGLSLEQTRQRFDDIVAFSDVEAFLDTPVKFWSSGMLVRLGFAVAVVATPDVLLVDEVLAVGDAGFQARCLTRMAEVAKSGTTVLVVSHSLGGVRALCDRSLVLHQGVLRYDGPTPDAIETYYRYLGDLDETGTSGRGVVHSVRLLDDQPVPSGSRVRLRMDVTPDRDLADAAVWIGVGTPGLLPVYTEVLGGPGVRLVAGVRRTVDVEVDVRMPSGDWVVSVRLRDRAARTTVAAAAPEPFSVVGPAEATGLVDLAPAVTVRRRR